MEIRLFDDDGNEVTGIGPDHPGELFVRSPSVFADYYKQHDRYLADNRDGWQTVGDIAYRDDEGFLYICDRKKDMIISGGMNIYPAEIEAALELAPRRSTRWRCSACPARSGARRSTPPSSWRRGRRSDAEGVIAHAREHLASYKIPRSVSFVAELPKTGLGQGPQARPAGALLGRPHVDGRLSRPPAAGRGRPPTPGTSPHPRNRQGTLTPRQPP